MALSQKPGIDRAAVSAFSSMLPATEATVTAFDYGAVAELFPSRSDADQVPAGRRKLGRGPVGYRRFARSADAIRFAIEELSADLLLETYLEVDQEMFDRDGILRLYESSDYPLARRATPGSRRPPLGMKING